jgi:hypothetical protein
MSNRLSWPAALKMQDKVDNITSNLNMLIHDYSELSRVFSKTLEKQRNQSRRILSEERYNDSIVQYESLQNFGNYLLNNIEIIKTNLEILETKIGDVQQDSTNVIKNINNIRISDLQSISQNTLENNVDTSELNSEQNNFVNNLSELQDFKRSRTGRGVRTFRKNITKQKKQKKQQKTKKCKNTKNKKK